MVLAGRDGKPGKAGPGWRLGDNRASSGSDPEPGSLCTAGRAGAASPGDSSSLPFHDSTSSSPAPRPLAPSAMGLSSETCHN